MTRTNESPAHWSLMGVGSKVITDTTSPVKDECSLD